MRLTRTISGLLLGFGIVAVACGGEEKPNSPAEPPSQPAAQRPAPAAAAARPDQATLPPAEQLSQQLAPSFSGDSPSKVDCLSNAIVDQLGVQRFNALIAIALQESAGARAKSGRTAQETADFEKVDGLLHQCGLSKS